MIANRDKREFIDWSTTIDMHHMLHSDPLIPTHLGPTLAAAAQDMWVVPPLPSPATPATLGSTSPALRFQFSVLLTKALLLLISF